jgi:hypothetical protein
MSGAATPETTLEELTRVREELHAVRIALMALCSADDAYQASYKIMMRSPLHEALEESNNTSRVERQRNEAITLCVELGRSLKDHLDH